MLLKRGSTAAHRMEPTACTANSTPTQLPAAWKPAVEAAPAALMSTPQQFSATAPFV